jgi:hypothetical protein
MAQIARLVDLARKEGDHDPQRAAHSRKQDLPRPSSSGAEAVPTRHVRPEPVGIRCGGMTRRSGSSVRSRTSSSRRRARLRASFRYSDSVKAT